VDALAWRLTPSQGVAFLDTSGLQRHRGSDSCLQLTDQCFLAAVVRAGAGGGGLERTAPSGQLQR
jgi:hypothetical protein